MWYSQSGTLKEYMCINLNSAASGSEGETPGILVEQDASEPAGDSGRRPRRSERSAALKRRVEQQGKMEGPDWKMRRFNEVLLLHIQFIVRPFIVGWIWSLSLSVVTLNRNNRPYK